MLTSANSLRFWLGLCGALRQPGAAEVLQIFEGQEVAGKYLMEGFCEAWTAKIIQKVCAV